MNSVDWLTVSANASGFIGSVLLATPFFRENRLKRILSYLRDAPAGSGGAAESFRKAQEKAEWHLTVWKPIDYRLAIAGIIFIGLSYSFNILVWILVTLAS